MVGSDQALYPGKVDLKLERGPLQLRRRVNRLGGTPGQIEQRGHERAGVDGHGLLQGGIPCERGGHGAQTQHRVGAGSGRQSHEQVGKLEHAVRVVDSVGFLHVLENRRQGRRRGPV